MKWKEITAGDLGFSPGPATDFLPFVSLLFLQLCKEASVWALAALIGCVLGSVPGSGALPEPFT